MDHEATNCQYEINFDYSDALTTADRYGFMKFMIKVWSPRYNAYLALPTKHIVITNARANVDFDVCCHTRAGTVTVRPVAILSSQLRYIPNGAWLLFRRYNKTDRKNKKDSTKNTKITLTPILKETDTVAYNGARRKPIGLHSCNTNIVKSNLQSVITRATITVIFKETDTVVYNGARRKPIGLHSCNTNIVKSNLQSVITRATITVTRWF